MAGRKAFVAARLCGSRREVGKAASQVDNCSCRSEAEAQDGTGLKDLKADIEAVVAAVVDLRLVFELAVVGNVVAGQTQDCKAEVAHRREGREECFARVEQAVVVRSAAAKVRGWIA